MLRYVRAEQRLVIIVLLLAASTSGFIVGRAIPSTTIAVDAGDWGHAAQTQQVEAPLVSPTDTASLCARNLQVVPGFRCTKTDQDVESLASH
jgi:hypothetical protein